MVCFDSKGLEYAMAEIGVYPVRVEGLGFRVRVRVRVRV